MAACSKHKVSLLHLCRADRYSRSVLQMELQASCACIDSISTDYLSVWVKYASQNLITSSESS